MPESKIKQDFSYLINIILLYRIILIIITTLFIKPVYKLWIIKESKNKSSKSTSLNFFHWNIPTICFLLICTLIQTPFILSLPDYRHWHLSPIYCSIWFSHYILCCHKEVLLLDRYNVPDILPTVLYILLY